jgi:hypothetical protein
LIGRTRRGPYLGVIAENLITRRPRRGAPARDCLCRRHCCNRKPCWDWRRGGG